MVPLITANAASPSPSPSAGPFKSNEDPTHEKGESAAQEAAENNGTFRPGGGGPGSGPSNESPSHEASESAGPRGRREDLGRFDPEHRVLRRDSPQLRFG